MPIPPSSDTPPISPVAIEVLRQFRLIFGSVRQHFREVEASCGVSGSQMWILTECRRAPGIGITELAGRLGIHQSTASILVEKLVSRRLVAKRRSQEDQRRVGLHLVPEGEALLAKLPGPAEGILPEALNSLPEVALKTLSINLTELIGKLRISEERYSATPLAELVGKNSDTIPTGNQP